MIINQKNIVFRVCAFICTVMILFLSPYAKYVDATAISTVYAVEEGIAGGAVAADAVIKFLIATFGTVAAKEAYEKYKEQVDQSFYDYMSAPGRWGDLIGESASSTCVKIYNKSKNTIESISWEDMMLSLSTGHDAVVDNLTDLYVQYCPALLKTFDDFITDVLSGDVYVQGFSDALDVVDTFSDYDSIRNVYGSYIVSGYTNYSAYGHFYESYISDISDMRPFACISVSGTSIVLYSYNDVGGYSYLSLNNTGYIDGVFRNNYLSYTFNTTNGIYAINIPVYSDLSFALAAFDANDFSDALNYSATTMESVIDLTKVPDLAPDIPPFTRAWQQKQWGEASDVIDFGGIAAGEYAGDDLPFWGLAELDEFAQTLQDIFDKALEGIFEGTDVIEFPTTYDDVWDDVFTDAWDRVKDGALDIPVDDTGEAELDKVRPYPWEGDSTLNPDTPANPDIPDNPAIDTPVDDVIDIPIEDIVPTVNDSFFDVAGSLRYKFPFSIPWDIYHLFSILAGYSGDSYSVPVQPYNITADNIQTYAGKSRDAPYFELPIVIERYGIDERIIVDMEPFEPLSILSRSLFSILFGMFLINLTFKVVGMRKEE